MTTPLFLLDLSEDARDYRHTALEPGLPLLDRQGVNYAILRKWLGDYVAEPEWQNQDVVAFYLSEVERGRLEDADCHPVSKGELQKLFAPDLDELRLKVKKIKPESSTEQMVARILKKAIAEQTNDLDNSDFDSYFFKCRAGKEDWRLVWCAGYQRADLEPLRAKLWNTPEGLFLGVRPPLQGGRARKRKRNSPLGVLASPWLALALMLLLALFLYQYWPALKITPAQWKGPMGSRIEYKVGDHRWFFFTKNVTEQAIPQSQDPRVVEFDRYGAVANAKSIGTTGVTFIVGNRLISGKVEVGLPTTPDSLSIEPAEDVRVAIGATRRLKAIAHYEGSNDVDLTTQVSWWEADDQGLLVLSTGEKGLVEGDSVGETQVLARFPTPRDDGSYAEASVDVQVIQAEFTSLAVDLQPETFAVGQSSRIAVRGVTADGEEHYLSSSSLLKVKVDPTTAATVDGEYLVGRANGAGTLKVSYGELDQSLAFSVAGKAMSDDVFFVSPTEIDNSVVYELIPLNVRTASDEPITAVSADTGVVEVFRTEGENAGYEIWLAARSFGSTTVTVSQADKSQEIPVTVTGGLIVDLKFDPPVYTLRVGLSETANLVGTTNGDIPRRIKVVPDMLSWERQPRVENVYVDKDTLLLRPLEPTELPQDLQVRLGDSTLVANATIEVLGGGEMLTLLDMDDEAWGVHPPIGRRRGMPGGILGDDALFYDSDLGGIVIGDVDPFSPVAAIPTGAVLTSIHGRSLAGMSADEISTLLARYPVTGDSVIRYRGLDGVDGIIVPGSTTVVRDLKLIDVTSANVAADRFDAEMRLYLREAAEYRLSDADGTPLSEWAPQPADATPTMIATGIPRNAEDDYELYVERRIGDQVRRFQVPFKLEAEGMRRTVDAVDSTIIDTAPGGVRGKETIRIRIPGSGSDTTIIRPGARVITEGETNVRSVSGNDRISIRGADGSNAAAAPAAGSDTRAPAPGSPAPNSPAPKSPNPAPSGSPSPAPPGEAPPSPAPPGKPAPAPPGSPKPAPPNPADPKSAPPKPGSPKPAPGAPAPPAGSDTRAPAPGKPVPAAPKGSNTRAPNSAYPAGSDTRFQPRNPVTGVPKQAGTVSGARGSATRGKVNTPLPARKSSGGDDDKPSDGGLLDALKKYNRRNDD